MATTYDVILGTDGDLTEYPQHGNGLPKVAQSVRTRLLTFLEEWVLDRDAGLPWFTWIEENFDNVQAIGGVIRAEVEETPGVVRVDDFAASLDEDAKVFRASGTVVVEGEESFTVQVTAAGEDNWHPGVFVFAAPVATI